MGPIAAIGGMMGSGPTSQVASAYHQQRNNRIARGDAAGFFKAEVDLANSAYQRQMADMKLAGLNPMLAAQIGGAAGASGSPAHTEAIWGTEDGARFSNSASDFAKLKKDLKAVDSQVELNAEAQKTHATNQQLNVETAHKQKEEAKLAKALTRKAGEDTNVSRTSALKNMEDAQLTEQQRYIARLMHERESWAQQSHRYGAQRETKAKKLSTTPGLFTIDEVLNRLPGFGGSSAKSHGYESNSWSIKK